MAVAVLASELLFDDMSVHVLLLSVAGRETLAIIPWMARAKSKKGKKTAKSVSSRAPRFARPKSAKPRARAGRVTAATPTRKLVGPRTLYILSDSTGNLPQHMLTAMLTQFPKDAFRVRMKSFLSTPPKLSAALDEVAKDAGGICFHAVV